MNRWKILLCSLACCALLVPSASAQFRASLQGTVTDTQGAVVPGVTVTLTSNETNITRQTTSNDSGFYAFTNLGPGRYTLTAERTGFKKASLQNVQVAAERTQGADIQLAVGEVAEEVTVSADALAAIQTETAQIGGTVTTKEVQQLPSFGRDPFQLLRLAPGVFGLDALGGNLPGNVSPHGNGASDSIFQTENSPQISANGQRTASNNFQVDGTSVNSVAWNGAAVITPNSESVKEVQLVANSYSAEFGRNNGAQVLVVSQNGTNSFHGSALLKAHRPGLNAYQKWNGPGDDPTLPLARRPIKRDDDRFNQWAGSIGGPIMKNKLFFFFSYETLRLKTVTIPPDAAWFEAPEFLTMAPSGSIAERMLTHPGEGASISGIVPRTCASVGLPATQCQETASGGLDVGSPLNLPLGTPDPTFPTPTNPQPGTPLGVGGGLDGIPDVVFANVTNPRERKAEQWNGRLDFDATSKDRIFFSTYWVPVITQSFVGPERAANFWTNDRLNWSAGIGWTRTISATMLNELRLNATRWSWDEFASNPQQAWGLPTSEITRMAPIGIKAFGAPGPSIFAETTYNLRDTVSKVVNTHNLRFGADIYREQRLDTAPWNARPTFRFRNLWDYLNDAPFEEGGNFDVRTGQTSQSRKHIRSAMYGFFVQDDWKVRPNLTVNLGLRWEYFGPVSETDDNISNVLLGTGANTLTDLRLKTGGTLFEASKNNWGPQIGFAWSPHSLLGSDTAGKVVFRGGFGIGYNRQMEASILDVRDNPPGGTVGFTFCNPAIPPGCQTGRELLYAVPDDVNQFTDWPANPNAVTAFDENTGLPTGLGHAINLTGVENDLPTTTTYRYSLDMQYDFGANWVATVGYQGSQTRHYTIKQQLNLLFAPLNPFVQSLQQYGNIANASYNGLLTELRHQFSRSFQVDAQYRWSHTFDQGSNDYYLPSYPWDLALERGSADYDVRHAFKLWGIWSPQLFGGQSNMLEKILGGWNVTGILNWNSGFPWTPVYEGSGQCDIIYAGSGTCQLRPATYIGGAGNDYSNETFQRPGGQFPNGAATYFTPTAFTPGPAFPATGPIPEAPGVARNSFGGPHYLNFDMTLAKAFGLPRIPVLGEGAQFEFRASAYNIFNKVNLKPLGRQVISFTNGADSNGSFGQASGAFPGRVIELQARFSF
jgi:outer membrane receptor protein involved in Fe transport